jgi:hypothetical protein
VLGQVAMVLITAYKLTPTEEEEVVKRSGADELVYKPLPKFGDLQALLDETIARRRAIQAEAASSSSRSRSTDAD